MRNVIKITLIACLLLTLLTSCFKGGEPGSDGKDGKSAYEVAVENGFNGTVDEWLVSLIGAKGDNGVGIENIAVDYKGNIVITLSNGERYETVMNKACLHTNLETVITHPTCGAIGYTSYSCADCGLSYKDNYTAATGHNLYNDVCLFCDYKVPYSEITPDTEWYVASQSSFYLTTREQLAGLSYLVNSGNNFSGKTVYLSNHIDLANAEWVPIGTAATPFAGMFNGQGLTISNLKITEYTSYAGLFGYVSGSIKDFSVTGANVTVKGTVTVDNYAAIACAYSVYAISGVTTAGHLNATVTGYVGGVVGCASGSLDNCSNSAQINAPDASYVGGVAGYITRAGSYITTNLSNSGAVTGLSYVGGIIGKYDNYSNWSYNDNTYYLQIDNFTNSGAVAGAMYVGGIIGYTYSEITGSGSDGAVVTTSTNLSNTGDVEGEKYVGGILGYAFNDSAASQIIGATNSSSVKAKAYVGGIVGKVDNIQLISCDNTGSSVTATHYDTVSTSYYAYVGGYAGCCYYIEDCHNASNITYNERGSYVGGVAGYCVGAAVNCSNTANITASIANYVGGIAGSFASAGVLEFATLSNSGNIIGADYAGGIMGSATNIATWAYNDNTYTFNMRALKNTGTVIGRNYTGGLIGYVEAYISGSGSDGSTIITVTDSENIANVTGDTYVGGIFGYAGSDNAASRITKTSSCGTVTANAIVGGLAGQLSLVQLVECSNAGTQVIANSYTSNATTYYAYVGGYVGMGYHVENCHNASDITYNERGSYVGGIAGTLATMVNCSNTASITANKANFVGGLAGCSDAAGSTSYVDLTNSGAVVGVNYVGGIVGYFNNHATWTYNDAVYYVTIRNINNTADIVGSNYVGGLIGLINAQITGSGSDGYVIVNILDSASNGNITGTTSVGSYIGETYSDSISYLNNVVLAGTVNGAEATIETVIGRNSNMQIVQ